LLLSGRPSHLDEVVRPPKAERTTSDKPLAPPTAWLGKSPRGRLREGKTQRASRERCGTQMTAARGGAVDQRRPSSVADHLKLQSSPSASRLKSGSSSLGMPRAPLWRSNHRRHRHRQASRNSYPSIHHFLGLGASHTAARLATAPCQKLGSTGNALPAIPRPLRENSPWRIGQGREKSRANFARNRAHGGEATYVC
jgi:hypothetical protein